ncbi:MAG: hypothetical protein NUV80_06425 [Candidatus Berkelbacteria bacterium]|nr:hypothetical protein [Candidatus Berkelbacteria bacterium]
MANVSRINGFRPVAYLSGAPYNGKVTKYQIDATDATALGVGDMVKFDGTADTLGIPGITRATLSAPCLGAIVGFVIDPTDLNTPQYRAALTLRYALVADDPAIVFECQANATCTAALVGNNGEVTIAAASTITGMSAMQFDMSVTGTTNTSALKILGIVQREDNAIGTYNKILVKINNHQLGSLGTLAV